MVSGATNINIYLGSGRIMDPDMALSNSPGLDDTIIPGDNASHSDRCGPSGSMALVAIMATDPRYLWLLVVPWITNINKDPHMVLTMYGSVSDVTMALCGSIGHSGLYGPSCNMGPLWAQVIAQTLGNCMAFSCIRGHGQACL